MTALQPYAVALVFGDGGPIVLNVLLAPSRETATAALLSEYVRGPDGVPKQPLVGVAVCAIEREWLRAAIANVAATSNVVKLASRDNGPREDEPEPPPDMPAA